MFQGIPLGVFERARAESYLYPFMLLTKFHHLLATLLSLMEKRLVALESSTIFSNPVVSTVGLLRDVHLSYLTMHPLAEALQALQHVNIPNTELVIEAQKVARVNPYFEVLIDFYEMYCSNTGLIHAYFGKGLPVVSSKLHELWILSKLVNCMKSCWLA